MVKKLRTSLALQPVATALVCQLRPSQMASPTAIKLVLPFANLARHRPGSHRYAANGF